MLSSFSARGKKINSKGQLSGACDWVMTALPNVFARAAQSLGTAQSVTRLVVITPELPEARGKSAEEKSFMYSLAHAGLVFDCPSHTGHPLKPASR